MIEIRFLGPGDEPVLGALARDGAAFERDPATADDVEPLSADAAAEFLADPSVLYWVAFESDADRRDVGLSAGSGSGSGDGFSVDTRDDGNDRDPREAMPVGELFCVIHRIAAAPGREVLLYEIGVHQEHRRRGIGRALLGALDTWLANTPITSVWLLADDAEAAEFYEACGFTSPGDQPRYFERLVD